jgi:hypothetical protein
MEKISRLSEEPCKFSRILVLGEGKVEICSTVCKKLPLISSLLNNIYRHSVCLCVLFVYFCVCLGHNRTIYKPVSIKRTVGCYRARDKDG